MLAIFKALGTLLLYPSPELVATLPAIANALGAEGRLSPATLGRLRALIERLGTSDLLDLEEAYVELFDRGPARSLWLFEHAYGDSRERGAAMVALRRVYARHGLEPSRAELPDYLPLLCEFLSLVPLEAARPLVAQAAPILALLSERIAAQDEAYAAVPAAMVEAAGVEVDRGELEKLRARAGPDRDPGAAQALDSECCHVPVGPPVRDGPARGGSHG